MAAATATHARTSPVPFPPRVTGVAKLLERFRETFGRAFEDFVVGHVYEHRPGRTITVCLADALAVHEGREKPIATMLGTMMCVRGTPSLAG